VSFIKSQIINKKDESEKLPFVFLFLKTPSNAKSKQTVICAEIRVTTAKINSHQRPTIFLQTNLRRQSNLARFSNLRFSFD